MSNENTDDLKQYYDARLAYFKEEILPNLSDEEVETAIAVQAIIIAILENFMKYTRGMSQERKGIVLNTVRRFLEAGD
jgi:hypothetical protein